MTDELEQMMEEQRHDEGAAMESHGCCGTCRYWRESDEETPYREQRGFCDAPVPAWSWSPEGQINRVGYYEFRADQCAAYDDNGVKGCLDAPNQMG